MAKATPATRALEAAHVSFTVHEYDYDPDAARIGLQAADALGVSPERLLKTLMARAGGEIVCVLVPSDREVNLKKLAAVAGAKSAAMCKPDEAERVTGFHVGGISPFGQKKRVRAFVEGAALAHAKLIVNGGRRGLQIELAPADLLVCWAQWRQTSVEVSRLLRRLCLREVVERRDDVLGERIRQRRGLVRIAHQADPA